MIDKLKYYARYNCILNYEIRKIEKYFSKPNFEEFRESYIVKYVNNRISSNSFYKHYYAQHGVNINQIKTLKDIDELPVLDKNTLLTNSKRILRDCNWFKITGHTSGTSGTPLKVYRSLHSIIIENAYVWWYRKLNGLDYQDKKISLRGDLNVNELYRYDKTSNTLYISSYRINNQNFVEIIKLLKDFEAKAILAYPSSLYSLTNLLEENEVKFEVPLCFTSSETLFSFQKENFERTLNARVFDWYGNAERSIALYSSNEFYFEPPLYSYFKILKEGGVVTTNLTNTMFPLINYLVNDDIEISDKYSTQKKSKQYNKIYGRIEDYILLPDGARIKRLGYVFKGVQGIKFTQIIQNSRDEVLFNIVKNKEFDESNLKRLKENIYNRLGKEIKVKISYIQENEIIYTSSNKYKLIISNI